MLVLYNNCMRVFATQSGVALVEVILGISIITAMLVAVGFSVMAYVDARAALLDDARALYLAEEGYELARILRDEDWNTIDALALDTLHFFSVTTTTIAVSTSLEQIDDLYRGFELAAAYRDSDDDLTDASDPSATVDPDVRLLTVYVWDGTATTSLPAVLTNLHAI